MILGANWNELAKAAANHALQSGSLMIHRYIFHNGHIMPVEEARLSPGQAGLLSGWGLFTTMRIFRGEPFAFERHWRRLEKDAGRTRMPFPLDASEVRSNLRELIRRNDVSEGTARIYAIYNKFGFWQSDEPLPEVDLLLCTAGLPSYHEPARLAIAEHSRHAASPLAGVKVTSWLVNLWSLQGAQQRVPAKSIAAARCHSSGICARWAAIIASTTFSTFPPAR